MVEKTSPYTQIDYKHKISPNSGLIKIKDRFKGEILVEKQTINPSDFYDKFYDEFDETEIVLGSGSHAFIKKVIRKSDGKSFAVKIIRSNDCEVIEAVRNEFNNIKRAKHQNVVEAVAFYDEIKGKTRVVLENLESYTNFSEMIANKSKVDPLTKEQVAIVFIQTMRAIQAIHKSGMVHRDINPSNIMVDKNWRVKLVDFGVAKSFTDVNAECSCYTPTGTSAYKAPEIWSPGEGYSYSVDIWAAGVILVEALTGKKPFKKFQNLSELVEEIEKGLQLELIQQFEAELKDLVSKMMVMKKNERLTVEQVLNHPWCKKFEKLVPEPEQNYQYANEEIKANH